MDSKRLAIEVVKYEEAARLNPTEQNVFMTAMLRAEYNAKVAEEIEAQEAKEAKVWK